MCGQVKSCAIQRYVHFFIAIPMYSLLYIRFTKPQNVILWFISSQKYYTNVCLIIDLCISTSVWMYTYVVLTDHCTVPVFYCTVEHEKKEKKILSSPSFGGEVKPSVPCRRFAACKRSLNLRGSRNLGKITGQFFANIPPFAAWICHVVADVQAPGGESGNV